MDKPDKLELPLGFGFALAQNEPAMKIFETLSEQEKAAVIQRAHNVKSKNEMQAFVSELISNNGAEG